MTSKKDYIGVSRIFAERVGDKSDDYEACRAGIARDLATYFQGSNPRFDKVRFLKACRVETD